MGDKCPICGDNNSILQREDNYTFCGCIMCGNFFIEESILDNLQNCEYSIKKLKTYLFYNKSNMRPFLIEPKKYAKVVNDSWKHIYNLTPEIVENWYPKTFAEKIDKILLRFNKKTQYIGEKLEYNYLDLLDTFMIDYEGIDVHNLVPNKYKEQIYYFSEFLRESGYMTVIVPATINGTKWSNKITFRFTPKGLARVEDLQKSQTNNKNVFVSMAFNTNTIETRNAIRQGIIDAGFSPEFIDEIIHNHQIVPEMLRLIRECRFLILDITDPNFGAYYEAGYAAGLDKEVIVCCKKEVFEKKVFQCEYLDKVKVENNQELKENGCAYFVKATKPHFDIAQKQTLVWDNYEDLTKKLTLWIKSIIR